MVTVGHTQTRELSETELELISDDEKNREFGSDQRRQQFLCGRSLLRLMLQDRTGAAAASHQLTTTDDGKPVCVDGPAVSITHTNDRVACSIVSDGEIGIDMEVVDAGRDMDGVAKKFFSDEESEWLDTQPENRFYMLWVLKEAYIKALGRSIFSGLNRLRCKVCPPVIDAMRNDDDIRELYLYKARDSFLALAVTEASLGNVVFQHWPADECRLAASNEFFLTATTSNLAE